MSWNDKEEIVGRCSEKFPETNSVKDGMFFFD